MLLKRFLHYVNEHKLATTEDKILLTVSGGVDSMVMMTLFVRGGFNVGVAHCNFQLRGDEANEDEELVRKQAAMYGLEFYNMRFDTQAEIERSGESTQMVARRLRYEWFDQLCAQHGYTHIAIAHHVDDSVETFFINLVRGTGLRGLTGINVINGRLIRPLLFSTRKDIAEYAVNNKIPYREDSSNSSTKYLRNKIRLGVVPRIREVSPHFSETMRGNVERLTLAQKFIDCGMDILTNMAVTVENDVIRIDPSKIPSEFPRDFVIYELMSRYGFKGDVIDSLYKSFVAESTGRRFYGKDKVAYIDRNEIIISPIPEDDDCCIEVYEYTKRVYCGNSVLTFEHIDIDDLDSLHTPDNVAVIDESNLVYPLLLRRWNDGDIFVPFGMSGHKKVSDLLINMKVSIYDKQRQFVLTSAGNIVWVVGRRIDERYRLGSKSEYVLRITKETL